MNKPTKQKAPPGAALLQRLRTMEQKNAQGLSLILLSLSALPTSSAEDKFWIGIDELLTEEHETIRSAAHALRELLALPQPDAAARRQLGALGLELAERLVAHVQKEEMALLPALEDLLDEETDRELALAYANS